MVLKIDDLIVADDGVMACTKLVGRLVGSYRKVFDDTAVGVQVKRPGGPDVIEEDDTEVAAVAGVITLTTSPLRWNTSTTTANAIGGVYEYVATVSVVGQAWKNEYVFRFMLDEQANLTLDGDGNVSYDQVASDSDGVILPGGSISLESLSDTDTTSTAPTASQVLAWNAVTSRWEPAGAVNQTTLDAKQLSQDVLISQAQSTALAAQSTADTAAVNLANEIASTDTEQTAQDALLAGLRTDLDAEIASTDTEQTTQDGLITGLRTDLDAEIASTNAEQTSQDALIAASTTALAPTSTAWTDGEITGASIDHRNTAAAISPSVLSSDSFFRYKKLGKIVFIEVYLKVTAGGFGSGQFRVYGMDTNIGARVGSTTVSTLHGYATLGSRIYPVQALWASNAAITFYAPRSTSRPDMTNMADDQPETWSADDFVRVSGFVSIA